MGQDLCNHPQVSSHQALAQSLPSTPHLSYSFILRQVPVGHEETIVLIPHPLPRHRPRPEEEKHNDNVWKHVLYL